MSQSPQASRPEATAATTSAPADSGAAPGPGPVSFEQAAREQQPGFIAEFIEFLAETKAWWLTPIVVVLLLVGLIVYLGGSAVAPFIYTIF